MTAELVRNFEANIEAITLLPSDGGRFEVIINDQVVFSKLQLYRHAEPGEVSGLIRKTFGLPG